MTIPLSPVKHIVRTTDSSSDKIWSGHSFLPGRQYFPVVGLVTLAFILGSYWPLSKRIVFYHLSHQGSPRALTDPPKFTLGGDSHTNIANYGNGTAALGWGETGLYLWVSL